MDDHSFNSFVIRWNNAQAQATPQLHDRMATWLDRSWRAGDRELLLLAFRDSGKSTIVGLFCAWRLALDPDTRILVLAADLNLAKKMVRTVKRVVERHPFCAGLKPRDRELWGAEQFTVERRRVGRDPSMAAKGVTANFTGSHADLVVCDDVEVPNTCDTPPKRADLRRRLAEIAHVLAPGGTVLYIGTPHTPHSIYARQPVAELGEAEPFLAGFKREELPVTDAAGNPLWPERFPTETIERIRRRSGPQRFAGQMLLTPVAVVDGRLDPDRLRPYDAALEYREAGGRALLSVGGVRMVSARAWWDPALGANAAAGDGSVLAVVFGDAEGRAWIHRVAWLGDGHGCGGHRGGDHDGRGHDGGDDAARRQCRQVAAILAELHVPAVHLETNGLGAFLPGLLRQELRAAGLPTAVIAVSSSRPKHLRILEAFDARLAAGALYAHRGVWDTPFVREMREWRPDGRARGHDDGLDAVAGCLLADPVRLPLRPPGAPVPVWHPGTPVTVPTDFEP